MRNMAHSNTQYFNIADEDGHEVSVLRSKLAEAEHKYEQLNWQNYWNSEQLHETREEAERAMYEERMQQMMLISQTQSELELAHKFVQKNNLANQMTSERDAQVVNRLTQERDATRNELQAKLKESEDAQYRMRNQYDDASKRYEEDMRRKYDAELAGQREQVVKNAETALEQQRELLKREFEAKLEEQRIAADAKVRELLSQQSSSASNADFLEQRATFRIREQEMNYEQAANNMSTQHERDMINLRSELESLRARLQHVSESKEESERRAIAAELRNQKLFDRMREEIDKQVNSRLQQAQPDLAIFTTQIRERDDHINRLNERLNQLEILNSSNQGAFQHSNSRAFTVMNPGGMCSLSTPGDQPPFGGGVPSGNIPGWTYGPDPGNPGNPNNGYWNFPGHGGGPPDPPGPPGNGDYAPNYGNPSNFRRDGMGGFPGGDPFYTGSMSDSQDFRKFKAERIQLPQLPAPAGFYVWRALVRDAVTAAYSYDPDSAHRWILEVEREGVTLENLGMVSTQFASLDAKLSQAINSVIENRKDDLTRQIINLKERRIEEAKRNHNMDPTGRLRGRQILFIVYEYFKVDPASTLLYNIKDLMETRLHGDQLSEFLAKWDNVMIHMREPLPESLRLALFVDQIKRSTKMQKHFEIFSYAPPGSPMKSFEYLYGAAREIVERERMNNNRNHRKGEYEVISLSTIRAQGRTRPASGRNSRSLSARPRSSSTNRSGRSGSRDPNKSSQICIDYSRGYCRRGRECRFRHSSTAKANAMAAVSSQVCRHFANTGSCSFGDKCKFSHDTANKTSSAASTSGHNNPGNTSRRNSGTPTKRSHHRSRSGSNSRNSGKNRGSSDKRKGREGSGSASKRTPRSNSRDSRKGKPGATPKGTPRDKNSGTGNKKSKEQSDNSDHYGWKSSAVVAQVISDRNADSSDSHNDDAYLSDPFAEISDSSNS